MSVKIKAPGASSYTTYSYAKAKAYKFTSDSREGRQPRGERRFDGQNGERRFNREDRTRGSFRPRRDGDRREQAPVDIKKIFKKIPLQQLRLYATVQNLYTFTGTETGATGRRTTRGTET